MRIPLRDMQPGARMRSKAGHWYTIDDAGRMIPMTSGAPLIPVWMYGEDMWEEIVESAFTLKWRLLDALAVPGHMILEDDTPCLKDLEYLVHMGFATRVTAHEPNVGVDWSKWSITTAGRIESDKRRKHGN